MKWTPAFAGVGPGRFGLVGLVGLAVLLADGNRSRVKVNERGSHDELPG